MDVDTSNKRIAKNTMALYFRMMLQMIIGLYSSRVILQALGVDDFGIYNVVGSVTTMFSFISGAMSNATMRFITFEIGKKENGNVNKVFCVSMNIHFGISIVTFIILETIGVWFLYNKMVIEPEKLNSAFWVLQFSIISCVMGIISVPYNAFIIAHEKMGSFAIITLLQTILMFLFAIIVLYYPGNRLVMYAFLTLIAQIVLFLIYIVYCRLKFVESTYRVVKDRNLTIQMAKFAGWTMNGNIAWLGYTQGLNMLLNMFYGTAVNAARGIAVIVQSKIFGFCDNFQLAVRPQITKSYSLEDYNRMHDLIIYSSKFSYFLLLIISLPVFIEVEEILRLWLGVVPDHTGHFVRIILLCSVIDVLKNPMNASIHATGNIKKFQIWEASTLLLIVPLAYLALYVGLNPEYVFIVQLIIFIIVQFERVLIVCPRIKMSKMYYLRALIWPIFKVTIIAVLVPLILVVFYPIEQANWIQFISYIIISIISAVISIYIVGLNKYEKFILINQINKMLK